MSPDRHVAKSRLPFMSFPAIVLCAVVAAASSESFVTVDDGTQIHYVERVPAQPVSDVTLVLLPGWMMPGAVWKHQLEDLGSKYRVIAIDPRSQGDSTKTSDGNYPARRAEDLRQFVMQRQLSRVLLVAAVSGEAAGIQCGARRARALDCADGEVT